MRIIFTIKCDNLKKIILGALEHPKHPTTYSPVPC